MFILKLISFFYAGYTRRGFFGFGPLCGTGVTSFIDVMKTPFETKPRTEDSRPEPVPLITTATSFSPIAWAFTARVSPTFAAAKGVPFFAPLKPRAPAEEAKIALPFVSVKSSFVLLYVDCTYKVPLSRRFFEADEAGADEFEETGLAASADLTAAFGAAPTGVPFWSAGFFPSSSVFTIVRFPILIIQFLFYVFSSFFLPEPMVFRTFPRRVREFVFVRWPRVGNRWTCREPR
jgi:hypothetical protein